MGGRGREPGQVERQPANQQRSIGFRRWREPLPFQPRQNEVVDRVAGPLLVLDLGQRRPLGWNEGPVLLPLCALFDPAANQLDLPLGQLGQTEIGRGHAEGFVGGADPLIHDALRRVAPDDRKSPARELSECAIFRVEVHIGLAVGLVRPMAGKTPFREDGPDIAVECNRRGV